jgi:hypothetical protein
MDQIHKESAQNKSVADVFRSRFENIYSQLLKPDEVAYLRKLRRTEIESIHKQISEVNEKIKLLEGETSESSEQSQSRLSVHEDERMNFKPEQLKITVNEMNNKPAQQTPEPTVEKIDIL